MKNVVLGLVAVGALGLWIVQPAQAQQAMGYGTGRTRGDTYYSGGCGSSWAICRYRANLRRNGEYAYRRSHNGNPSPAYQTSLAKQRAARPCNPANVWRDACG